MAPRPHWTVSGIRTRAGRCLVGAFVLGLVLTGCAEAADDPGALPPGSDPVSDQSLPPVADMCIEDEPDCDDTVTAVPSPLPEGPITAAPDGACLEGATECADAPGGDLPSPPEGMDPRMVEPHEDLVDVRAVPWVEVQPNDDQTVLTVSWWGGNEACYGLDHVDVDETDEAVTVTVHTGRNPKTDVCTEEAILKATTIELSAELGPRSILDGATS